MSEDTRKLLTSDDFRVFDNLTPEDVTVVKRGINQSTFQPELVVKTKDGELFEYQLKDGLDYEQKSGKRILNG